MAEINSNIILVCFCGKSVEKGCESDKTMFIGDIQRLHERTRVFSGWGGELSGEQRKKRRGQILRPNCGQILSLCSSWRFLPRRNELKQSQIRRIAILHYLLKRNSFIACTLKRKENTPLVPLDQNWRDDYFPPYYVLKS